MALTGDVGGMSVEAIGAALEAVRARVARADQERAELERAIATAREEERLLERLLALRRDGVISGSKADGDLDGDRSVRAQGAVGDPKHPAVEAVVQEFEAAGRPLHISELMRLLREKKVAIPGSGTQANLIAHLRRDERLVRPSRGMYGLAAWGLQSMPPVCRVRRRRRRMRSTASQQGGARG
jgi:hypothetical protein